jgi:xanthine dehydrogenase YagS FAD-binding subunit
MLSPFSYVRAESTKEAVNHLSTDGARIHAGGTDLLGCLHDHVFSARKIVSISGIEKLRGIRETSDGGLKIGALTTITEIAHDPLVQDRYGCLAQGAAEVASPQLRNRGTLGGNLCQKPRCWYYRGEFHCLRKGGESCYAVGGENQYHCILGGDRCFIVHPSDTAPALVALGGEVRIVGSGKGRTLPLEHFYVLPGMDPTRETVLAPQEIVTEIRIPPPPSGLRSSYRKVRARRSWDFALAGVALALTFGGGKVTGGRVVLSGAAPIPWRSQEVEEVITGKKITPKVADRAAKAAVKGARPLSENGYKVDLFRGLLEEELLAIATDQKTS